MAAARGNGAERAHSPSRSAKPAVMAAGTARAGERRTRSRAKPRTASSETSDDAIITAGSDFTWKAERKSVSRVALPATCWAMRAAAPSVAARTAERSALAAERLKALRRGPRPGARGRPGGSWRDLTPTRAAGRGIVGRSGDEAEPPLSRLPRQRARPRPARGRGRVGGVRRGPRLLSREPGERRPAGGGLARGRPHRRGRGRGPLRVRLLPRAGDGRPPRGPVGGDAALAAARHLAVADGGAAARRLGLGPDREGVQAARARGLGVPPRLLR